MNEKRFELAMPLAVVIGAMAIAAAIYLKPSEYDRCVDRYVEVVQQGTGDFSPKNKKAYSLNIVEKCAN